MQTNTFEAFSLPNRDVRCSKSPVGLNDVECYAVVLAQCPSSILVNDGREVYEVIFLANIWCDEAVPLGIIEPLDASLLTSDCYAHKHPLI